MKLFRAFCAIALLFSAGAAMAAGTLPLSLSQQVDINGKPLAGALLYTFIIGTVAQPQNTYQDTGLTILNAWPLQADQNGRLPMFYLADGSTHVRLTDSSGNVQYDSPSILVIGPSGGGGGGSSVDPTTIISTGDLKVKYGTGALSGFVRANGLTIGNTTSGATERANADTQALFIYLYNADPSLTVSGGRTGNALNDYNSSKTITMPDWRGRAIGALGDMGNSATSILTSTYAGCTPTTLGAQCGIQNQTISVAQMPLHQHNVYLRDPGHTHSLNNATNLLNASIGGSTWPGGNGGGNSAVTANQASTGMTIGSVNGVANDNLTAGAGSGSPLANVSPMMLATIYIKL